MRIVSILSLTLLALGGLTVTVGAPALAQSTPVCGPLDDGRVANVFYEGTAVFFEPIVEYEYDLAVLTISGPCEDIVHTFKRGEEIFFDIREIERVTDGHYTWQLRFEPTVDSGVREDLEASRGTGTEDDVWWSYWQKGAIPVGPRVDSASFTVFRGGIIDPNSGEEKSASLGTKGRTASVAAAAAAGIAGSGEASGSEAGGGAVLGTKDVVFNDDMIVIGSLCVGFDCVNGEVFSFDTIRLKENNLRIKFEDTSGGSFPTRDWEIEANSSANGGQTHFRINDVDAARSPFTVEGNAPSHSLYVDSSGRVGMGTSTPVVELHVANGDTPALRLDQNTSSGFAAQVWDVAGNETSFFVRDATNGSTLPFRIFPGASSNSLIIDDTNNVGIGTTSPDGDGLEIERGGTDTQRILLRLKNNGSVQTELEDTSNSTIWRFGMNDAGDFVVNDTGDLGTAEMRITTGGDVFVNGVGPLNVPDYVFSADYELRPLDELSAYIEEHGHLPNVQTAEDVRRSGGLNITRLPVELLEKVEELTLYTLQQERKIADLNEALNGERAEVEAATRRNEELSAAQADLAREMEELKRSVEALSVRD